MTRKDYLAIAEALREAYTVYTTRETPTAIGLYQDIVRELCRVFKSDNARFDHEKFRQAVGG